MAPQNKGGQELKNKPQNVIKASSWTTKINQYVVLLLLEFKNYLWNFI